MKTLQQQYQLIKEGKGNKEQFLKQARYLFPEYITVNNDYNTTVGILKSKSILSEGIGGVVGINPNSQPNWFKIFDTNLKEAVGVKNTKEYGNQNEFEADADVKKILDKTNFDNKDEKNIDNVYGQSFLMGYYTEMKDPKNAEKTVDELKAIVLKNMSKDITYYNTKASFGVKDIGYTKDVVGGGEPVAPKGKYKSSGYGDMPKPKTLKEGTEKSMNFSYKDQEEWSEKKSKMYDVWVNKSNELVDLKDDLKKAKNRNDKDEVKLIKNKILQKQIAIKTAKEEFQKLSESLNKSFEVDPSYTHFAVRKSDNKIVNGWEYDDLDTASIKEYSIMDLQDMGLKPSDFKILTVKGCKAKGIDPFSWDNWLTPENNGNTEKDDEVWIDPAGGTHYGNEDDPAAMYKENKNTMNKNLTNESIAKFKQWANGEPEVPKTPITEAKKAVGSYLKEIEKASNIAALESKIQAANEAIENRQKKLELSESEDFAEMMDPKKISEIKKEIKQLEKYKMQCEKQLSKAGGKKTITDNEETIDENESVEENIDGELIDLANEYVAKFGDTDAETLAQSLEISVEEATELLNMLSQGN